MNGPEKGQHQTQLFRVAEDLLEQQDVAAEHPGIVERLLSKVKEAQQVPIVGIEESPVPTRLGLGGPASALFDNRPPNREPYAESVLANWVCRSA